MTTAQQLISLLKSHVEGDDEQFLTIALQAAASEARRGHGKVAVQLRELQISPAPCLLFNGARKETV